jgi:tetratricopeptide (TPR) repeat protein
MNIFNRTKRHPERPHIRLRIVVLGILALVIWACPQLNLIYTGSTSPLPTIGSGRSRDVPATYEGCLERGLQNLQYGYSDAAALYFQSAFNIATGGSIRTTQSYSNLRQAILALTFLGYSQSRGGKPKEAADAFRRALRLLNALEIDIEKNNLGGSRRVGDSEVLPLYDQELLRVLRRNLAYVHLQRPPLTRRLPENWKEAVNGFQTASQTDGGIAYLGLGDCYYEAATAPDSAQGIRNRHKTEKGQSYLDKAIGAYRKASFLLFASHMPMVEEEPISRDWLKDYYAQASRVDLQARQAQQTLPGARFASALLLRYERTKNRDDLAEAIEVVNQLDRPVRETSWDTYLSVALGATTSVDRVNGETARENGSASKHRVADRLEAWSRRHSDTLLLHWLAVDEKVTLLISVFNGRIEAFRLRPVTGTTMAASNEARRWITAMQTEGGERREPEAASLMGRLLWPRDNKPTWGDFTGVRQIIAVAEGPLARVPVAALYCPGKRAQWRGDEKAWTWEVAHRLRYSRLAEIPTLDRGIVYAVSFTDVLANPGRQARDRDAAPRTTTLVLGTGHYRLPLAGVQEELATIRKRARQMPGLQTVPRRASEAVPTDSRTLLSRLEEAREGRIVLHFAGHGSFDSKGNPALEFSETDLLTADSIRTSLSRPLELAVLSACSTNAVAQNARLGTSAVVENRLTEALRRVGTKAVLVTSWNVSDQGMVSILGSFWNRWFHGESAAAALNHTVCETKKREVSSRHWAAFRLYGDFPTASL